MTFRDDISSMSAADIIQLLAIDTEIFTASKARAAAIKKRSAQLSAEAFRLQRLIIGLEEFKKES